MYAVYIEERGPVEGIRYGCLPEPRPGPSDVLVRTVVTAVNPVDTFVRSGVYRTPLPFPFVLGRDLVGTVVEAGPGAAEFRPGDRVWCNSLGHAGRQGAAAELAVVPADRLYRLPDGVRPEDAVAVVHPGATAYLALFTHGGLRPGETVLVRGAAGNVGSAVTVFAAQAGATVVATASGRDTGRVRELGAAEVLDHHAPELTERIRRVAPGGVDVCVDTAGRNDLAADVELLAPRGRIVLLAGVAARPELPVGPLYMKDGSLRGFVISRATSSELAEAAQALNRQLAAGRLRPRQVEELPLSEAAEAHRWLEEGRLHGKRVLLRPSGP